jgi:hypothetical protein
MTTTPAMTVKVSGTMVNSNQKCGQKWGASDLFSNVALLEPTGNNEKAGPPAKKGKTYLKPNNQATGHPTPRPIGKGSGEKTTRSITTEAENKARSGDNIHSSMAKCQTIASSDITVDTDNNSEMPHHPVKRVKT